MDETDKIMEVVKQLVATLEEARLSYGWPVLMTALVFTVGKIVRGIDARKQWQAQFDELMDAEA